MAVGKLPPQQPQQQVGGLSKNQQLGLFLSSLSDVFAGKDPSAGFIQRQQFLQQQQLEKQAQDRFNKAYELASPEQKKLMDTLGTTGYQKYTEALALKGLGLSSDKTADIRNFEYFESLPPEQQETFKMLEGKSEELAFALAEARRIAGSQAGLDLSPLELERDKKVASELIEFERGGFASVQSNLDKLDKNIKLLESGQDLTGPVTGNVPIVVRAFTNPESVGLEDDIRSIIFQSLRETLGAQFTEREGEKLIAATFNNLLSEEINAERLKRLRKETANSAQAKLDMIDWFDKNRTMRGYKGKIFDSSNLLDNLIKPEDYADLTDNELELIFTNPATTDQELNAIRKLLEQRR